MLYTNTITVRFSETDMAGHVNNAMYLTYLEEARMHFIRQVLLVDDVPLILASVRLDFLQQVFFGDTITIETGVCRLGTTSFDMTHQLYRDGGRSLALTGLATLVRFNYQKQIPEPISEEWRTKLAQYTTEAPLSRT